VGFLLDIGFFVGCMSEMQCAKRHIFMQQLTLSPPALQPLLQTKAKFLILNLFIANNCKLPPPI
jgi:hypothetical protein